MPIIPTRRSKTKLPDTKYSKGRPQWPFTINRSSPQARGLINWWPFDPRGTTSLFDIGNRDHGTLQLMDGSNWKTSDRLGGPSLDFNGSDEYVQTPSNFLLNANSFTMAVWFKADSDAQGHMIWQGDGSANGWGAQDETHLSIGNLTGDANSMSFFLGSADASSAGTLFITISFSDRRWTHAAATVSSLSVSPAAELFVNGVSQGTDTGTLGETSRAGWDTDLRIGRPGASTRFYDGQLAEVRIYGRALTAAEVWALYDPRTRWDLYLPLQPNRFSTMAAALAAGIINMVDIEEVQDVFDAAAVGIINMVDIEEVQDVFDAGEDEKVCTPI